MGIYIPKIEKPNDCGDCDFYRWGYCHIKHARVETEDGVDADCPLIEVKEPHGRLVDIDKVMGLVASGVRFEIGELSELTTVIEAEGE